jgi:hypothetical protein
MLLDGKMLRNIRETFKLSKNFEGRDLLQKYVDSEEMQKKYKIVLDTKYSAEQKLSIIERKLSIIER